MIIPMLLHYTRGVEVFKVLEYFFSKNLVKYLHLDHFHFMILDLKLRKSAPCVYTVHPYVCTFNFQFIIVYVVFKEICKGANDWR